MKVFAMRCESPNFVDNFTETSNIHQTYGLKKYIEIVEFCCHKNRKRESYHSLSYAVAPFNVLIITPFGCVSKHNG